jgi:hypothetical protein
VKRWRWWRLDHLFVQDAFFPVIFSLEISFAIQELLTESTLCWLKDGMMRGHLASIKRFCADLGISNVEFGTQSAEITPADPPKTSQNQEHALVQSRRQVPANNRRSGWEDEKGQCNTTGKIWSVRVYKLPLEHVWISEPKRIRIFYIGKSPTTVPAPEKIIFGVGAIGSGKTTWLNWMCNYLCGVGWIDDFRFKVIAEENETFDSGLNNQAITHTD